ncbi:MAG: hypothetical protein II764_04115, partial [Bacteroidales bacterium]|nr:hypothetical protein [Bacteroidales bacterium]
ERRRRKNDAKDCFVSAFFKTGIAAKALDPTFAKVDAEENRKKDFCCFPHRNIERIRYICFS